MSKTNFFKWQLPFLTLDINVKFNFKATFINIVYAYFQPYVYYISDVKFLGYVLTTLFVIVLFNFA
jgi:hypothetical protein